MRSRYISNPDLDTVEVWPTSSRLSTLALTTTEMQAELFVPFLERQYPTFWNCSMNGPWFGPYSDGWRLVLRSLRAAKNLEYLHFEISRIEIGEEDKVYKLLDANRGELSGAITKALKIRSCGENRLNLDKRCLKTTNRNRILIMI